MITECWTSVRIGDKLMLSNPFLNFSSVIRSMTWETDIGVTSMMRRQITVSTLMSLFSKAVDEVLAMTTECRLF